MNITIISVGKIKEKYIKLGIEEFSKRLSRYCKLTMVEVPDEKTPDNASEREMELIRRDEREIGEQIGAEKERKKAEQELKKVKENLDKSQENAVQSMISLCQRLGGTKEQAIEELQGNYGQTEEQAKEKIKTYWKE